MRMTRMIKNKAQNELNAIFERFAPVFRALAHPARLSIANALLVERLTVGELAQRLDLSQSTLSQHLAQMRLHGLVEADREGQRVYYRVIHPAARTVISCIRDQCG